MLGSSKLGPGVAPASCTSEKLVVIFGHANDITKKCA